MNSRDKGFYKTPVVKSLLVLTSASSFLQSLAIVKKFYPEFLFVIRVWSLPSLGLWLTATLILYQYRILERRKGSSSFMSHVVLSGTISMALYSLLIATKDKTGLPLEFIPGTLIFSMLGSLAVEYASTVLPTRRHFGSLPISSNVPLYFLVFWFSSNSFSSLALMASGILGSVLVQATGLRLPRPPSWLTSALASMLAKDPPPRIYSGASLSVQAQQRTDEVEQLLASLHQRRGTRRVQIGRPVRQEPAPPPEEQVQHLVSMGFSEQESVQALRYTGNVESAIQLLTSRQT